MDRRLWGRRFGLALVLVLSLLILGTAVSSAAPAESSHDWCNGYVVRYGQTLSGIAAYHGVSVYALASYNGISNPNYVQAGQCLCIPPAGYYGYHQPSYGYHQPYYGYQGGHWVWQPGRWVWVSYR